MKNRKIKTTKIFKITVLFLGISLLLWNCKEEEFISSTNQNKDEFVISENNFYELSFDKNYDQINNVLKKIKSKKSLKNYSKSNDDLYKFEIETKKVRKIEKDSTISYTFLIRRNTQSSEYFENLVLSFKENKTPEATLVKYIPSEKIIFDYEHKSFHFKGKIISLKINYENLNLKTTEICFPITHVFCTLTGYDNSTGQYHTGTHFATSDCYNYPSSNRFTLTDPNCYTTAEYLIPTNEEIATPSYGGGGSGGSTTSPLVPCDVESINNEESSDGLCFGEEDNYLELANELELDLLKFSNDINSPSFDAINNPWLKILREYAKRLEELKDKIPSILWDKMNQYLDQQLTRALTKTAFKLNPDADQTKEANKEHAFKNDGKKGVGYLLYEFANGTGKDERHFPYDYDMTQQMLAGNVPNDIKADFFERLDKEGITYNQFLNRVNPLSGGYSFSPDHTGVIDSFNKHINANWVQFFIGGASAKYSPSSDPDWIIVELSNGTSRNSLLLHIGENYDRDGSGNNKPISTIKQHFKFKLKVR